MCTISVYVFVFFLLCIVLVYRSVGSRGEGALLSMHVSQGVLVLTATVVCAGISVCLTFHLAGVTKLIEALGGGRA